MTLARRRLGGAGVTKSRRAVGVSVAMPGPRSLVDERQSQFTHHWWNSPRRLDCISRPNGSQSRNGFASCLGMRPRGRRFETVGSTWLACRCFGDAGGYTLRTLAAGWHSNAVDYAFHRWFHGINRSKLVTCTYTHARSLGAEVRVTASATTKHGLGVLSQILVSTNRGAMPCPQERWSQPCRTCG